MDTEFESYILPTETLPGLNLAHHLDDVCEFRDFVEARGIITKNTRIERYILYLKNVVSSGTKDGIQIFKHATDERFVGPFDWWLYVLREVHELMWILRGLKKHIPAGVDKKLSEIVSGTDFAALDKNTASRNAQFELRIASYFCQAGCLVDLTTETDIIAIFKSYAFYIECKRVGNPKQVQRRIDEAAGQLLNRMPSLHDKRAAYGCIVADVTKAAFRHNGLTFGQTGEHSKDIVQKKLVALAEKSIDVSFFDTVSDILMCWLQIHIPSLIRYPPTTVTRFSSYLIPKPKVSDAQWKALQYLNAIFVNGSKPDGRETPPEQLKLRKEIALPKETKFWFDPDMLKEYLQSGKISGRRQEEIIAGIILNGRKHEFSVYDMELLSAQLSADYRATLVEDEMRARIALVVEMYLRRYPYENTEDK